jgi:hypothetical protein
MLASDDWHNMMELKRCPSPVLAEPVACGNCRDIVETAEAERDQALDHLREVRNQLVKILKGLPL